MQRWRILSWVLVCFALASCSTPSQKIYEFEATAGLTDDVTRSQGPLKVDEFAQVLNEYRAKHGLAALSIDPALTQTAQTYANQLAAAGVMTHTLAPYGDLEVRLHAASYYYHVAAENLAEGQKTLAAVFSAWQHSPHHDENMREHAVTRFGLAYAINPNSRYKVYWVLQLADPMGGTRPGLALGGFGLKLPF